MGPRAALGRKPPGRGPHDQHQIGDGRDPQRIPRILPGPPLSGADRRLLRVGGARGREGQPYRIHRPGSALFAMAGIWALWRGDGGAPLATFSILTRDAPIPIRWLHHRVPVILPDPHWTDWLARGTAPETLHAILADTEPPELRLHPVARAVNRAGYDEPDCIEEVELDD